MEEKASLYNVGGTLIHGWRNPYTLHEEPLYTAGGSLIPCRRNPHSLLEETLYNAGRTLIHCWWSPYYCWRNPSTLLELMQPDTSIMEKEFPQKTRSTIWSRNTIPGWISMSGYNRATYKPIFNHSTSHISQVIDSV